MKNEITPDLSQSSANIKTLFDIADKLAKENVPPSCIEPILTEVGKIQTGTGSRDILYDLFEKAKKESKKEKKEEKERNDR